MKRYKTRDGVVLATVCGESLLVSASSLRGICPFVTVLNDSSAFLWNRLRNGASLAELENAVQTEYEIDDPLSVRTVIEAFLQRMSELNYLIMEDQGGSKDE